MFRTDPRSQDYICEKGAKRNTDPWKRGLGDDPTRDETDEQRLDRLEREMAEAEGDGGVMDAERNAMAELEAKTADAKREMAVADALDEIRSRNARIERAKKEGVEIEVDRGPTAEEEERRRLEREDEEAARRAFAFARGQDALEEVIDEAGDEDREGSSSGAASAAASTPGSMGPPPLPTPSAPAKVAEAPAVEAPSFKRQVKKKKDHAALLGIKKKQPLV